MHPTSRWTHLEWAGRLCWWPEMFPAPFLSSPTGPWLPCTRGSGWVVPTVMVFEGDHRGFSPWHILAAGLGVWPWPLQAGLQPCCASEETLPVLRARDHFQHLPDEQLSENRPIVVYMLLCVSLCVCTQCVSLCVNVYYSHM